MVTRPYHSDEEPAFRRFSSRGNSTWHISHDRFAGSDQVNLNRRSSTRDFQLASQDSRDGDHDSDGDSSNQAPRRRIAVAVCGNNLFCNAERNSDINKRLSSAVAVASERFDAAVIQETVRVVETANKQEILNANF